MSLGDLKRKLYEGGRPGRIAAVLNRGWAILHSLGLFPNYLVTLEVRGRRSGRIVSLPLVMAVRDGERYLVSMLGDDAAWVLNVRAANGRAVLRHGRTEEVLLEEIPVAERAPIVKDYLQRAPGARPHVPVDKDAPIEEFEAIVDGIPVFRVGATEAARRS